MTLWDGEAGIDCINCSHKVYVHSDRGLAQLERRLTKNGTRGACCPQCGHPVTIEDYLGDDPAVRSGKRSRSPGND